MQRKPKPSYSWLNNPLMDWFIGAVAQKDQQLKQDMQMQQQRRAQGRPVSALEMARIRATRDAKAKWQTIAQPVAGLAATTVANSARAPKKLPNGQVQTETGYNVFGYRPAIVDALPAFAGTLGVLGEVAGLDTAPAEGSFLSNSMERMNLADQRTNATLGIKPPQNAAEMGLNIAGSLAVPGLNLTKLSEAGKLGKALATTAEIAVPLRQGSYASAAKTVVPLGVGIREGLDAIVDTPDYRGAADNLFSRPAPSSEETTEDSTALAQGTGEQGLADDLINGIAAEDIAPEPEPMISEDDLINGIERKTEEEKLSSWEKAGLVLGAAALGVAGTKVARALIAKGPAEPLNIDTVIGRKEPKSRGDRMTTAVFDAASPVRTNANTFLTPDFARRVNYKLDTLTNQAVGAQVKHFLGTGWAPNASKRYTPVARVLEPLAKDLKPEQQTMLGDALLFATALDDYKRTGVQSSFNDVSVKDMEALVNYVKNDPVMNKHMLNVQKSYAELLDYEADLGRRGTSDLIKFRTANPNYVHMSRDVQPDVTPQSVLFGTRTDANQTTVADMMRNVDEERAGVQKGAVRNPIDELANKWRDTIQWGRINDLRYSALDEFASSGAKANDGSPLVRRLPDGETPKSWEKVHTVYENGKPVHYQVNDPAMDQAMKFQSRFSIKPLEAWRQLFQSMTTGTLGSLTSGFQMFVSPIYDTTLGMVLRPDGAHLGLINEALSKINSKATVGIADPTALFGAYTGGLRYLFDDFTGAAAGNLTDQLMRDNSLLRQAIGDNAVTALRDKFQQVYQTSTKALGDELGVFSHTMRGTPDSTEVITGIEDLAPNFSLDQGRRVAEQAMRDSGWYQGFLAKSKVPWIAARTSPIGRMFQATTEAMHNGFRYSALASNRGRMDDLDQLAAEMRRMSVDSSRHGASDTLNAITGATNYSNLALQTFYELGRRLKESPVTTTTNMMTVLGGMTALHYAAIATDPEAREQHMSKTPEQRTRSITTFGGAEMPIEPLMRLPWSLLGTYMDHVSGANDGFFNPHFLSSLDTWFEDNEEGKEALRQDTQRSLFQSAMDNFPITPDQAPILATTLAAYGVDPGMTRGLAGEGPAAPFTQNVSGFDADKRFTGGLMSAYMENLISTAIGSLAEDMIRTSDEVYRAAGHYKGPVDALRTVSDRWQDRMAQGSKVFKPMLFGQYENVRSVADSNFGLLKERQKGIEAVMSIYHKDVMAEALQGSNLDPRYSDVLENGAYQLDPKYLGTPLQTIGMHTQMLQRQLRPMVSELAALNNEKQRVEAMTALPLEDRNKKVNAINEQRKALTYQQLMFTRQMEDTISDAIGQEFSYDGFDPSQVLDQTPSEQQ